MNYRFKSVLTLVFILFLSLFIFGFFKRKATNMIDVNDKITKIAIIDVKFDKRFKLANNRYKFSIKSGYENAGKLTVDEGDINYLQESATAIINEFKKNKRFTFLSGSEVTGIPMYDQLFSKKRGSIKLNKNFYQVTPYKSLKFSKKQRKRLAKSLEVDAVAQIEFGYFYADRFTFTNKVINTVNPIHWIRKLGIILKAKEADPNSMGLYMYINIYNKKGKKIMKSRFFSLLEQTKPYRVPGYEFHLYPSVKLKIERSTDLLLNNASDLHELKFRQLTPTYRIGK